MSEEQLKAFLEKVKSDTSLQEKLEAAAGSDAVLAIAKEAGFSIFANSFTGAASELAEEELEGISGGANCLNRENGRPSVADGAPKSAVPKYPSGCW